MIKLLVGFDSAWTSSHAGGLAGALQIEDGTFRELGPPETADFLQAERVISRWQSEHAPAATIILLDQPTIVENEKGQRPVENLASSPVCRRFGAVQPANTSRLEMFGREAPVWHFLSRFGGPADPLKPVAGTSVVETYPVLAMIALGWTLPDARAGGRLPKYNPARKKFSPSDWSHVCALASHALSERKLSEVAGWLDNAARNRSPSKSDQDRVDACLCLLVALHLAEGKDALMIGNLRTGYIVAPHCDGLYAELEARCSKTGWAVSDWIRVFRFLSSATD